MLDVAALRLDHGLHPGAKLIDSLVDEGLGHILPCLRDPGLEMFHVSDGHLEDLRHQVGPDPAGCSGRRISSNSFTLVCVTPAAQVRS